MWLVAPRRQHRRDTTGSQWATVEPQQSMRLRVGGDRDKVRNTGCKALDVSDKANRRQGKDFHISGYRLAHVDGVMVEMGIC